MIIVDKALERRSWTATPSGSAWSAPATWARAWPP